MFKPRDEFSRVDTIWQQIRDLPDDAEIRFGDMPFDKHVMYQLKDSVAKRMEREQQRTLVGVRGEGWRIVRGVVHSETADRDRRGAVKRMKRGLLRVTTVDLSEMSARDRERHDDRAIRIALAHHQIRGSGRKLGLEDIKRWQQEHPDGL